MTFGGVSDLIDTSLYMTGFVISLLVAFVGVSGPKVLTLPAIFWGIHLVVSPLIYVVDVDRGEEKTNTYVGLPFATLTYEYQGQTRTITADEDYILVNNSLDYTLTLNRNGGSWPFGIYTIEPMEINVAPGEYAVFPTKIRGERNAQAAYFRLSHSRNQPSK